MPSPSEPRTSWEIERWAHQRLPHEREAIPVPGERLLFRQHDFGEAVPAEVHAVQDMTVPNDHWGTPGADPDPNVWHSHPQLPGAGVAACVRCDEPVTVMPRSIRMNRDPWPWVSVREVRTGDDGAEVLAPPRWTKESRVRGAPGWLREGSRSHTGIYTEGGR